jgi:magnesium transporter
MLTSFVCTSKELKKIEDNEIKNYIKKRGYNLWINVSNIDKDEMGILKEVFKIHPTTIEDIFSQQTVVKYEDFDSYKVIIYKGIKDIKKTTVSTYNIAFVIGDNFVITVNGDKNGTIEELIKNNKRTQYLLSKGKKYLVHYVIDKEVDNYVKLKSELNDELNKIEIEFMTSQKKETLTKVYAKELIFLELRHLSESTTDLCLSLAKPTENKEDKNLIPYFKDIYDHAIKTTNGYKSMLERMNGMEEMYATMTSLKTNEAMRSLTIIMALMMPLTIITSFYGMNITLPFQAHPQAWMFIVLSLIISAVVMILISRRRGWIAGKD